MSHARQEPLLYHNQELMDETNEMFIRIKAHLFIFNDLKTDDKLSRYSYPKPTVAELDNLMTRIINVLRLDNDKMIKR